MVVGGGSSVGFSGGRFVATDAERAHAARWREPTEGWGALGGPIGGAENGVP